jgi:hypothetical protein
MIAIVENGVITGTKREGQYVRDSQGLMRKIEKDISEGWYEFIPARDEAPEGKKAQGTTFVVGDGVVTESFLYVDKTQTELDKEANTLVLAQIHALEPSDRRIREAVLTEEGKTWLATNEASIAALRATLITIPE